MSFDFSITKIVRLKADIDIAIAKEKGLYVSYYTVRSLRRVFAQKPFQDAFQWLIDNQDSKEFSLPKFKAFYNDLWTCIAERKKMYIPIGTLLEINCVFKQKPFIEAFKWIIDQSAPGQDIDLEC